MVKKIKNNLQNPYESVRVLQCKSMEKKIPILYNLYIKYEGRNIHMGKVLEASNIEKYYGSKSNLTKAIDNISFSVDKGEFVGIMGASGSGKSTLLNCISTIDRVTAGHIHVNGVDVTKLKGNSLNKFRREELGFIFQDFNLLDTLTSYENIAIALTIQKVRADEVQRRVNEIAEKLGINNIMDKYPYQISGGQKQRVASARAIVRKPKVSASRRTNRCP